jgi:O-antigen/teichoic acid export membrane protein
VNVCFGSAVMLIVFLGAPYVADFYGETRLIPILRMLSVSFLISSIGISHQAVLERNLQFGRLAKSEIISTSLGAIVGISLALGGWGVWSLVFQALTTALVSSFLLALVMSGWRPTFTLDLKETRTVARFSLNLSGFNLTNYFVRNADSLLIGKFLGAKELGFYVLAYRMVLYPWQNVTAVLSRVMFPVYSKIHSDQAKFRGAYLNVASIIGAIAFPIMLGIVGVSTPLVQTFFGEKWSVVASLLVIFAPIGLLQSVDSTTGSIYLAKSRTDWMFRWGLATGAVSVAAYAIGLKWGITGVASGYLTANVLCLYPGLAIPFSLIELKLREFFLAIWRPLVCASLMLTTMLFVGFMVANRFSAQEALAVLCVAGGAVYIAVSFFLNRDSINSILSYVRQL